MSIMYSKMLSMKLYFASIQIGLRGCDVTYVFGPWINDEFTLLFLFYLSSFRDSSSRMGFFSAWIKFN